MLPSKPLTATETHRKILLLEILLFASVVWLTHFFHANSMGLYEDDWTRIPFTAGMSWPSLLHTLKLNIVVSELSQGRPLHPLFVFFFSFLGLKTGSLLGAYAIAFLIACLNALLFRSFLLQVFHDRRFALLGTLGLCLFPADTTQPFLTHALGLQTALTLLLIAYLCYFRGWKIASYLVIGLVLFNYETPYLLFAAAPILQAKPRREWYRHWAALAGVLVFAVLVRKLGGEARVEGMSFKTLLIGSFNIVSGPLTSISMYIYHPVEALVKLRGINILVMLLAAAGFTALSSRLANNATTDTAVEAVPILGASSTQSARLRAGLLLLLLAYPLTLTTRGISIAGRGTRVHSAAAFGAAILFACACSFLLDRAQRTRSRLPHVVLGCWLGLLVGFGLVVQQDYVLGWQEQREFWTDLLQILPPLKNGDVILVDPAGLRDTRQLLWLRKDRNGYPSSRQIRSLDNVINGLPGIDSFPSDWNQPPRVFRLPMDWEDSGFFAPEDRINLRSIEIPYYFDPDSRGPVDPSQVIFIDTKDGHLSRRTTLLDPLDGKTLHLNSEPPAPNGSAPSAFFRYIIESPDPHPFGYLVTK